jgi:hypothetical protein
MWLRVVYNCAVWYEVFYNIGNGIYDDVNDDRYWEGKIPVLCLSAVMFMYGVFMNLAFGGTRMVVFFGGFLWGAHLA